MASIAQEQGTDDRLAEEAIAIGMSIEAYKRSVEEDRAAVARMPILTQDEFQARLNRLRANRQPAPTLPPDFSRRDIYEPE